MTRFQVLVPLVVAACSTAVAATGCRPEIVEPEDGSILTAPIHLPLRVREPGGDEVWGVSCPSIPDFQRTPALFQSGGEATFWWTPLPSQTGTHQCTFTVTSSGLDDSVTTTLEAAPEGWAPVFLEPGAGGTFDLTLSPCVDIDIVVSDEDDTRVDIYEREPRIEGAELAQTEDMRARWHWCPTAQQVDTTLRYALHLEADDGRSPPLFHSFQIVLVSE